MKLLRLRYFLGAALIAFGIWVSLKPRDWQNWLGFSHQAYFVTGQSYAFFSGPLGPILTALGLGTIISTLLRHLNCHVEGCPRLNRHKVAHGEYGVCGRHWREIEGHARDHKFTVEHIRERHHRHLKATGQVR